MESQPLCDTSSCFNAEQLRWQSECLDRQSPRLCGQVPYCLHTATAHCDVDLQSMGGPFQRQFEVGQVTLRFPMKLVSAVAVAYGFMPFLLVAYFAVELFFRRRVLFLCALLLCVCVSGINELCVKPLFLEPRPRQASCLKPGFPSGHTITAYALLTWFWYELACCGVGSQQFLQLELVVAAVLTLPTPWARWYNLDHTAKQVVVSMGIGVVLGVAAGAFSSWADPRMRVDEWYAEPLH
eukprot:TRINITY_DN14893_c0_g1_i2.p1 TRINITY_DN14893_c0_g1~~TRINITY_DN14893_c0_g1_i2.p1  ORF type:complete len:255 (+),score=1.81 TRINITY_DN14893_c0_g1_i2:51-767(+)